MRMHPRRICTSLERNESSLIVEDIDERGHEEDANQSTFGQSMFRASQVLWFHSSRYIPTVNLVQTDGLRIICARSNFDPEICARNATHGTKRAFVAAEREPAILE